MTTVPGVPPRRLPVRNPLWQRTLDRAGVPEGPIRGDYAAAARVAARRYPALYPGARLVVPLAWQAHMFAVGAVAVRTDGLVDVPVDRCDPRAFHTWAEQVRLGLDTGRAEQPILRAFLHTVDACSVDHADVRACLAGQAHRLGLRGYTTEQDHHDNIDRSNMPLIRMLFAICRVPPHPRNESAARLTVDAVQRWDDLADLADDLRRGLLTIPETDLLRFRVTRTDLETGRDTPAVRSLLAHTCARARVVLHAAQAALDDADPAIQFVCRPMLMVVFQAMGGLERQGPGLLRPRLAWHFRPTTTHLADGLLRTLDHRIRIARQPPRSSPRA